ncbi:dynamin family protein, partial [Desulfobulbus sp. AH-315-M07]|nr:dynamin family protein [Desulfobulbus sp. AH-315-M07]
MSDMAEAFDGHAKRRDTVVRLMQEMRAHASDLGASTLATRIGKELVDKLESDRFNLVVVGEFNHGKTSFVNALLGKAVLPVGVTPTTAVIHHLKHGAENAVLVLENEEPKSVSLDELANFSAGSKEQHADVVRIEVDYPAPLLSERIVLVDTPGVNDLCLQRADITYEYIPRADAVLFVIDAGQPLKESERIFLRDKLIGQSRDKIIFVVAKADIWSSEERDEALAYIRSELGKLVDAPTVFAVSAQKVLAGETDAGMREFVAHLSAYLAEERGRIVLDNALGESLEVSRALSRG